MSAACQLRDPLMPAHSNAFRDVGLWMLVVFIGLAFAATAPAAELFVSIQGRDDWSGVRSRPNREGTDGPFRSLLRAQSEVRKLAKSSSGEAITVTIREGTHYLESAMVLDTNDLGEKATPVVYRAFPGERVTISAGRSVTGCTRLKAELLRCDVANLRLDQLATVRGAITKTGAPSFELFSGNRRLPLARWPNAEEESNGKRWAYTISERGKKSRTGFLIEPLKGKRWARSRDILVRVWSQADWFDEYLAVESVDLDSGAVVLRQPAAYDIGTGHRFYFSNVREELDSPGEWYFDSREQAIYALVSAQEQDALVVSYLENVFRVRNTNSVVLKDLRFAHSRASGIVIEGGSDNRIEGCTVVAAGAYGIDISGSANRAVRNVIHDVGQGGIILRGGDRQSLTAANNYAEANHIYRIGQLKATYRPAIMVEGVGNRVVNNLIHDAPHAGIIIAGNDHMIEGNELYDLCLVASDCGAVYSGRDWSFRGNQLRFNRIHDIPGYGLSRADERAATVQYSSPNVAVGIYLDDAVSGFNVYGNVLYRIGRYGIQIGGGRDNLVTNNVIVDAFPALVVDERWATYRWTMNSEALQRVPYDRPPWSIRYPRLAAPMRNLKWPEGNEIRHNVFARSEKERCDIPLLSYSIPEGAVAIERNLMWAPGCGVVIAGKLLETGIQGMFSLADWKVKGFDTGSVVADPLFVDPASGNYDVPSSSPALMLGFRRLSNMPPSSAKSAKMGKSSAILARQTRREVTTYNFDFHGNPK